MIIDNVKLIQSMRKTNDVSITHQNFKLLSQCQGRCKRWLRDDLLHSGLCIFCDDSHHFLAPNLQDAVNEDIKLQETLRKFDEALAGVEKESERLAAALAEHVCESEEINECEYCGREHFREGMCKSCYYNAWTKDVYMKDFE